MNSHLDSLADCPLHKKTPFGITNVSMTQFSIARYSGLIKYNGDTFIYLPDTDELVRDDVLKWKRNQPKETTEAPIQQKFEQWT